MERKLEAAPLLVGNRGGGGSQSKRETYGGICGGLEVQTKVKGCGIIVS